MSRKAVNNTEFVEQKAETTPNAEATTNVEVNEATLFEKANVSPLKPKDPNDGWSYYWAIAEGSGVGTASRMRLRGFEKVRAYSDGEIPTYGGERNENNEVVYGGLVLMKRPKSLTEKEREAKIREYRRLANQKEAEFEEAMEREGAEYHPNRSSFYFAENPLAK